MKFLLRKAFALAARLFRRRLSSETPFSANGLNNVDQAEQEIPTFVRFQPTNLEIGDPQEVAATLARNANINAQQTCSSACYCKLSDCTSFRGPWVNLGADCDVRSFQEPPQSERPRQAAAVCGAC